MEPDDSKIQLMEPPCGQHGPYTFYKMFKYYHRGKKYHFSLGEFFFLKISKNSPVSIGELQLLWSDKNYDFDLASLKIYFLPDCIPGGRQQYHGKDEVIAVSEKVVLKLDDLRKWIVPCYYHWNTGTEAVYDSDNKRGKSENIDLSGKDQATSVLVVSYPQYCRLRGILRRVEGLTDKWLKNAFVEAMGGFTVKSPNTRIVFCRDTFECEELEEHEFRCDHLAPNLKGRPRKKKVRKDSYSEGDSSNGSITDIPKVWPTHTKIKSEGKVGGSRQKGIRFRDKMKHQEDASSNEKEFFQALHKFMKERNTPIGRIPCLGFKQIDLYFFYTYAQKLGGYKKITERRLWKHLYDKLGGNPTNTGAATCTRRHYERLLLPYELFMKGEADTDSVKEDPVKPITKEDSPVAKDGSPVAKEESPVKTDLDKIGQVNGQLALEALKKRATAQQLAEKERQWIERRRRDFHDKHRRVSKSSDNTSMVHRQQADLGNVNELPAYSPLEGLTALSHHPSAIQSNPFTTMQHVMGQSHPLMFPQMPASLPRKRPQVYGPPDLDFEHLCSSKRVKASPASANLNNGHGFTHHSQCDQPQDLSMKSNKHTMGDPAKTAALRTIGVNHTPIWRPNKPTSQHPAAPESRTNGAPRGNDDGVSQAERDKRDQARLIADMATSAAAAHFQPHVHPAFMMRPPMTMMSPNMVSPLHLQQLYQAQLQANVAHAEAWKKLMASDESGFQMPGTSYFMPGMAHAHQVKPN